MTGEGSRVFNVQLHIFIVSFECETLPHHPYHFLESTKRDITNVVAF